MKLCFGKQSRHAKNQAFFWASFLKTKIQDKPVVVDDTEIKKKGLLISRILNFHFLHTALILLLGKDRTESHMATDRSLETDCRNDFFPREKHLAVRFRSTHQNI